MRMRMMTLRTAVAAGVVALVSASAMADAVKLFDYTVVTKNNLSIGSNHIHGRTLVGGNLKVRNSDWPVFGQGYTPTASGLPALEVEGQVNAKNFHIQNGSFVHEKPLPSSLWKIETHGNKVVNAPVDTTAVSQIDTVSDYYAGLSSNSLWQFSGNKLIFNAAGNGIAIFSISAADLAKAAEFDVRTNSATSLIVNVTGANASFNGNFNGNVDPLRNKLLFNFNDALNVVLNRTTYGTILAPEALISGSGGKPFQSNLYGNVYASSVNLGAEIHDGNFNGPPVPTPTDSPAPVPLPTAATAGATLLAGMLMRRVRA